MRTQLLLAGVVGLAIAPALSIGILNRRGSREKEAAPPATGVKTPVLFVEGGPNDIAYDGGMEGYTAITDLTVPVLWLSKDLGHGGDLASSHGGDFTKIDLAWLNWWLKDDETATGKGLLVGAGCPYCGDSAWEYKTAHLP